MRNLARRWFAVPLWQRVVAALVLGVLTGLVLGPEAESIKWVGDLFIRAIKMLVVPLIFASLVSGVVGIGDLGKLRNVGVRAILLFLLTSVMAITLGILLGILIRPGEGLDMVAPPDFAGAQSMRGASEILLSIVPDNPVRAMADGDVLPLIFFSLLLGVGILMAGKAGEPLKRVFDSTAIAMQKVTIIVMEFTPFGVFALMAWVSGTYGLAALVPLAKLVAALYLGCLLMIVFVYTGLVRFVARIPVKQFYRGIADAQAVSYSTASSNATLPVTLECVQLNLGVSKGVSSFVVSLGATINMDGTALYLGLATLFGAQIFGVTLDATDYLMIVLTSTLGAIGAAGIPGSGLIMMSLVFSSVGVPLETIAIVAGIDRIMDMMRTMTNVTGDCSVAASVARMTGEIDVEVASAEPEI